LDGRHDLVGNAVSTEYRVRLPSIGTRVLGTEYSVCRAGQIFEAHRNQGT
jgi:hypothetical protein